MDPALPVLNARHPAQSERMEALDTAERDMVTSSTENRIKQELRSKLPPATKYNIQPGDNVLIYRQKEKEWMEPHRFARIFEKEILVDWEGNETHFNLTQSLPMPREQGNRELKRLLQGMEQFKSNPLPGVFITGTLHPADLRGHSTMFDKGKETLLAGLAERSVYELY